MNKTYKENLNMWALDTDADHILHRVGSDDYTPIRHTTAKDPDAWEEIAVADIPPYNEAEYKERRQSEYAAYQAYREDCKVRARAILSDSKCDITND